MADQKRCSICGYTYDSDKGEEKANLAPGTLWDDVPEDFKCHLCGAKRTLFK